MPTAALKTLGCKLNQFETEQLREQLERLGYTFVPFTAPADLYVINSCTVTSQADRDARKLARQARRLSPQACIVITGCYAEVAKQELQAMPEMDLVVGMADKHRLPELLPTAAAPLLSGPAPIEHFTTHTRGMVKVQEGCNSRCTYCIVPEARGPSRSVPFNEVYAQVRMLAGSHPELVLIGTHLGQYGRDLQAASSVGRGLVPRRDDVAEVARTARYQPAPYRRDDAPDLQPPLDVAQLVTRLTAIPELQRLRLSSMEPCEVSEALIALLVEGGQALRPSPTAGNKLCRHLHIPLQSGSDTVLQRMNRPYDTAFYADLLTRLHQAQPWCGLGADVIVGFPGETDEEFEQTRALLERLPLNYLHVFAYSIRRGTPAATMPNQVPPPVKQERSRLLRELAARKHEAFAQSMMGQVLETVLQTETAEGQVEGVTDNYLTLRVPGDSSLSGRLVACEVSGAEGNTLRGTVRE